MQVLQRRHNRELVDEGPHHALRDLLLPHRFDRNRDGLVVVRVDASPHGPECALADLDLEAEILVADAVLTQELLPLTDRVSDQALLLFELPLQLVELVLQLTASRASSGVCVSAAARAGAGRREITCDAIDARFFKDFSNMFDCFACTFRCAFDAFA